METRSGGKPSSPHVNSPSDSQYAQSSGGDAEMSPTTDPYNPLYAQISTTDAQTER